VIPPPEGRSQDHNTEEDTVTDAEKAEKMLLGEVCSECGEPYEKKLSGYVGLCLACDEQKHEEIRLLMQREEEESRKQLRPVPVVQSNTSFLAYIFVRLFTTLSAQSASMRFPNLSCSKANFA
jgi:hypothetical protein